MKNIIRLENISKDSFAGHPVFTVIGFFDGVHRGHQDIIARCIEQARADNGISIVFTFDNPPKNVIHGRLYKKLITSYSDKLKLIKKIGADYIVVAKFNKFFSGLLPEDFCREILIEKLNVSGLFIGSGFRFGKDAAGDTEFLKKFFSTRGVKVNEVPILKIMGKPVSSTSVREFYNSGDIESIKLFLGRDPSIKGRVIKGDSRGRLLGYPTANIDVFEKYVTPSDGVYAGLVNLKAGIVCTDHKAEDKRDRDLIKMMPSVINIGDNPTFAGQRKWIESHVLNFSGDIYGYDIEVIFLKKLRDEKKFKSRDELIKQIEKDIIAAGEYFELMKGRQ
ncbi:MAG: Riboflavin biosynthesis protein RibF [Actinobacteria bacterium ADurb.Bin346]|nr:MAG: Riboflavin biosynthesis protein RibF [Actinobacteria bacterium ADurb.Bin346]